MQAEQSILDRIGWMIFIGRISFTSGHPMVEGEEEDCNKNGRTK